MSDDRRHRILTARHNARGDAEACSIAGLPGISEAIRASALHPTPHALLSRGLAGLRGATFDRQHAGSPGGCRDGFAVLQPALVPRLELAAGASARRTKQT